MLRNLFRLLMALIVVAAVRYIASLVMSAFRPDAAQSEPTSTTAGVGHLRRDPVCGTYVAESAGVTAQVDGQTVRYCSAECRAKHQESRRA